MDASGPERLPRNKQSARSPVKSDQSLALAASNRHSVVVVQKAVQEEIAETVETAVPGILADTSVGSKWLRLFSNNPRQRQNSY
jgi:hypothetical protein